MSGRLNTPVNQTRGYKYEKYRRRNTNSGSEGMSNRREAGGSSGISVHGVFIQLRWLPFMRTPNRGPAWMLASKQVEKIQTIILRNIFMRTKQGPSNQQSAWMLHSKQVEKTQQMQPMKIYISLHTNRNLLASPQFFCFAWFSIVKLSFCPFSHLSSWQ